MIELRPYQTEAITAILAAWETAPSTVLELPTGAGKTIVFADVLRRRRDAGHGRALVLAHRRELLDQAAGALEAVGLTVEIERAEQIAHRYGLYGVSDVVVASVQTLRGRRLERWDSGAFGTLVIDECHHAPAATYRAILARFGAAKALGVTATPDRGDRIGLGHVFASVAYRYSLRQAITDGWLCPIRAQRVHCADLDLSAVRTTHGDLSESELQAALTVDQVLHQIAAPLVELAGNRPTIVFTAGVDQAEALAEVIGAYAGPGSASVVHGSQPPAVRAEVIGRYLAGETQFVANCAVLTEGFDAPPTACVAVARPTKSRALYAQMLGRGTRNAPGKTDLLVLDFVGNSGRHRLISPADVLAGRDLPDLVQRDLQRASAGGAIDLEEALTRAEERERERLRRLDAAQRRRDLRADVSYRLTEIDPFAAALDVLGVDSADDDRGPRATPGQLDALRGWGVDVSRQPSRQRASKMMDALISRRKRGLCSYKQAKVLIKNGMRADLSFDAARAAIDALAANRWRATPELLERYGRVAG